MDIVTYRRFKKCRSLECMHMNLFSSPEAPQKLEMPDAEVSYFPTFLTAQEAHYYFQVLLTSVRWQQDSITVFGKTHLQPRLTALYANNDVPYSYSNITMRPIPFTEELDYLKKRIEKATNIKFTTCLLNLYRDGQDSNGWHADNEKELGLHPKIASLSLGTERRFHFKHKENAALKKTLLLRNGSLLVMQGATQEKWLHQLPKSKKVNTPRINLTFRIIKQ